MVSDNKNYEKLRKKQEKLTILKEPIDTAPELWYLFKVPRKGARFMMF